MARKSGCRAGVDGRVCKGCGYCREVCPKGVFALSGQRNGQGYEYMDTPGTEKCVGCGLCVMICPDFAIRITE